MPLTYAFVLAFVVVGGGMLVQLLILRRSKR
jgi:hypothetical protein